MAGLLHGSTRTTPRFRAELQASQETTGVRAARYGLNPKRVATWRKRTTTTDQPMGPARPRSTVLSEADEAIVARPQNGDQIVASSPARASGQAAWRSWAFLCSLPSSRLM